MYIYTHIYIYSITINHIGKIIQIFREFTDKLITSMHRECWLNSKWQDNEIQKLVPTSVPSEKFSLGDSMHLLSLPQFPAYSLAYFDRCISLLLPHLLFRKRKHSLL